MCPLNFRDLGEFVNLIADKKLLHEKKIYRGGKIQDLLTIDSIHNPKTIINLRNSRDPEERYPDCKFLKFSIVNSVEKYDTTLTDVRQWLNQTLSALADPDIQFPVYVHCASGKDRTGVVIASLLYLIGIPIDIIIEEYLLSDGEKHIDKIKASLQGIMVKKTYFNHVDVEQLRKHYLISS